MINKDLSKLAEDFYKAAQSKKTVPGKDKKTTPKPVGKKQPAKVQKGKQVAQKDIKSNKPTAQRAMPTVQKAPVPSTPAQRVKEYYRINRAFPTPIGDLSTDQLYKHYEDMADRIDSSNVIDEFQPNSIVSELQGGDYNAPASVCMLEGGEGSKAYTSVWGFSFPALLVRFCNNENNPALRDVIGYTKSMLNRAGILTSNYIIAVPEGAYNTIRNSHYSKYVYVALDMDEDREADE